MRQFPLAAALLLAPGAAFADPALDEIEVRFVELINEYRADNGLGCLSVSPTANAAADYMSRAMGEQGFFSHNEPPCDGQECTGRNPFERLEAFDHVGWTTAGENIAAGSPTAEQVFEGWRNSPGHNANMLRDGFTAMGIARVEVPGSAYRVYWTNTFSNLIDGTHDCNEGLPEVGYGDPGTGGAGGIGGDGSMGGEGGAGGSGGAGGLAEGGAGGGTSDPVGPGEPGGSDAEGDGGCASAGGLSLLAFAAVARALRRR